MSLKDPYNYCGEACCGYGIAYCLTVPCTTIKEIGTLDEILQKARITAWSGATVTIENVRVDIEGNELENS